SLTEPVNHEDTSVSSNADINKNDLDCVVIPEISPQKRKLYIDNTSEEVGDHISESSSKEMVPTSSNYSELSTKKKIFKQKNKRKKKATIRKTVPGTKNAFDLMHLKKQKNARITNHNDIPNVFIVSSNAITRKKASRSSIHSLA
ncbi:20690_t:CDS:2, partial [Gigaspora margarita]